MTAQTRAINKGRFETGDTPQQSDYVDLIDSFLSLADTSAQTVTSDLTIPTLIATEVSAGVVNVSAISVVGHVSAPTIFSSAISVVGALSAGTIRADNYGAVSAVSITASAATINGVATITSGGGITLNVDTSTAASSGNTTTPVPSTAALYFPITVNGTEYWVPAFRVAT